MGAGLRACSSASDPRPRSRCAHLEVGECPCMGPWGRGGAASKEGLKSCRERCDRMAMGRTGEVVEAGEEGRAGDEVGEEVACELSLMLHWCPGASEQLKDDLGLHSPVPLLHTS